MANGFDIIAGELRSWRNEVNDQALAIETAKQTATWAEQSDAALLAAKMNHTPGEDFGKAQMDWYDQNQAKFADSIPDGRVRRRFQAVAASHKVAFAKDANQFDFEQTKDKQITDTDSVLSKYVGGAFSASNVDEYYKTVIEPGLTELESGLMGPLKGEAFQSRIAPVYGAMLEAKKNKITELYNNNGLNDEQYATALNEVANEFASNPAYKLSPANKYSLTKQIFGDVQQAGVQAKKVKKALINANYGGYKIAIENGEDRDPAAERAFLEANADDPTVAIEIQALGEASTFYKSISVGQLADANEAYQDIDRAIKNKSFSGKELEVKTKLRDEMRDKLTKYVDLQARNPAEAWKDVPNISTAKQFADLSNDYRVYMNAVTQQAIKNNYPLTALTFKSDVEIQDLQDFVIKTTDPTALQQRLLAEREKYDYNVAPGINGWDQVVKQFQKASLVEGSKIPKEIAGAFSYIDNKDLFNEMIQASKLSAEQIDSGFEAAKSRGVNIKKVDIPKTIASSEEMKTLMSSIFVQDGVAGAGQLQQQAVWARWAEAQVLNPHSGVKNIGDIKNLVSDKLKTQYAFASSGGTPFLGGAVNVRVPRVLNHEGRQIALDAEKIASRLKSPFMNETVLKTLLQRKTGKVHNGKVKLSDLKPYLDLESVPGVTLDTMDILLNSNHPALTMVTADDESGVELYLTFNTGGVAGYGTTPKNIPLRWNDSKDRVSLPFTEIQTPRFKSAMEYVGEGVGDFFTPFNEVMENAPKPLSKPEVAAKPKAASLEQPPKYYAVAAKLVGMEEGYRSSAYQDSGGTWTIGYGSTTDLQGRPIKPGTVITEEEAIEIRDRDLGRASAAVHTSIKVPLTDGQTAALMSLAYNFGHVPAPIAALINDGKFEDAASRMLQYTKANDPASPGKLKHLPGLYNRRQREAQMFLRDVPRR